MSTIIAALLTFGLVYWGTIMIVAAVFLACTYLGIERTSTLESLVPHLVLVSAIVAAALASGVSS